MTAASISIVSDLAAAEPAWLSSQTCVIMDPDTLWHIITGKRAPHATSKMGQATPLQCPDIWNQHVLLMWSLKVCKAQRRQIFSSVVFLLYVCIC